MKQIIVTGTRDRDPVADSARSGGQKINDNFDELYLAKAALEVAVSARQLLSEKGAPNGYASLDGSGQLLGAQLDPDLAAIAALVPVDNDLLQRKTGAWTNRTLSQVKSDLALNNVDNTSDSSKPVSTAQQAALDAKQDSLGFVPVPNTRQVNGHALSADVTVTKSDVGLSNVDNTADSAKPVSTAQQAAIDAAVVGLLDDRGSYDASVNLFPSAGGSGTAGAILKGDLWFISVPGTLGGEAVEVGDSIRALVDTPGQTAGNWNRLQANLTYIPENSANRDTDSTLSANSDTKYASQKAVKGYVDTGLSEKVTANVAVTGSTKTKITFDSKGLVTAGADATTADIADSLNKRYVTDAELSVLAATSGVNTGDQTSISGNAGSATVLQTARNIDGQSFSGAANITVIAPATHSASSKATPVDADELPLVDSASAFVLAKLTWANLKATLKTYFDSIYQAALGYTAENAANKDTDTALAANSDTRYASQKAVKSYIDTGLSAKLNTSAHRTIEDLVHNIARTSYLEVTRVGGLLTQATIWTDAGKTVKIREVLVTRVGVDISVVTTKQYSSGVLTETLTQTLSRISGLVSSITAVLT